MSKANVGNSVSERKKEGETENATKLGIRAEIRRAVGRAIFPRTSVGKKVMRVPGTFQKNKDDKLVLPAAAWMEWILKNIKSEYIFSWGKVPGEDNERLKDFLINKFYIEFGPTAKIDRIDDGRAIKLQCKQKSILFKNNGDNTVTLEYGNSKIYEFIAKWEGVEKKIYDYNLLKIIECEFNDIDLINTAISKGFFVEIICSVDSLPCYYELPKRDNINLYVIPMKAKQHGMLAKISGKYYLLLEDPHESDELYESALLVEDATSEFVNNYFINTFTMLLKISKSYINWHIEYEV